MDTAGASGLGPMAKKALLLGSVFTNLGGPLLGSCEIGGRLVGPEFAAPGVAPVGVSSLKLKLRVLGWPAGVCSGGGSASGISIAPLPLLASAVMATAHK